MNIWIIFIGFMILSWIISLVLKSKFKKYSKILLDNGMSGKEVAERMLRDHGISDVKVESVAALGSLATLLYYIMIFTGTRR
jgi:Zn-dependent membrane protease YugP